MTLKWLAGLFGAVLLFTAMPAVADDRSRANELFVKAIKLVQFAKTAPAEKQAAALKRAVRNLDEIIKKYPSTDLAVKLISGQPIGKYTLASIREQLWSARCGQAPPYSDYQCVIAQAQSEMEKVNRKGERGFGRAFIAMAQALNGDREVAQASIEAVLAVAKTRKSLSRRAPLLSFVSIAQAANGDRTAAQDSIAQVLEAVQKNKSDEKNGHLLANLASAQARVGDIELAKASILEVISIAEGTKRAGYRLSLYGLIAEAQAKTGDTAGARKSVAIVLDGIDQVKRAFKNSATLAFAARTQAELGDADGARATIQKFLKAVETEDDPDKRAFIPALVANVLVRMK